MLWQRKNKLLDKLREGVISDNDYQKKAIELEEKRRIIEERIAELSQVHNNRMKTQERLAAIREHISVTGIDKATLEELLFEVDKICIYPDHLRVVFKAVSMVTGLGFSCVQYQIRKLRREGSIEFHGKGGIGWWEVKTLENSP